MMKKVTFEGGWKALHPNMTHGDLVYQISTSFEDMSYPQVARSGMHYATTLDDLFTVYEMLGKKLVDVVAYGDIDKGRHLHATDKLVIGNFLDEDDINDELEYEGSDFHDVILNEDCIVVRYKKGDNLYSLIEPDTATDESDDESDSLAEQILALDPDKETVLNAVLQVLGLNR